MASATAGDAPSDRPLRAEALPVVDLRLLSLPELYALSLTSASSVDLPRCDDSFIPKIDRSVFNESAGSRKQTYCRLRFAQRKPELPLATIQGDPLPLPASGSSPDAVDQENRKIIRCLQELFETGHHNVDLVPTEIEYEGSVPDMATIRESLRAIPIDVANTGGKKKRGRKPKNQEPIADSGYHGSKAITVFREASDADGQLTDKNGVVVDVATPASAEDRHGLEIPIDVVDSGGTKKLVRKPGNSKPIADSGDHDSQEVPVFMRASEADGQLTDMNGVVVDVAAPANAEDLYGPVIAIDVVDSGGEKKRGRKLNNQKCVADSGDHDSNEVPVFKKASDVNGQVADKNGLVVDLAALVNAEDPYALEIPIDVVDSGGRKKRGRQPKNQKPVGDSGANDSKDITIFRNASEADRQLTNKNGVVLDVAALANAEDPYGPELRRRTEGLETNVELMEFLEKVGGVWSSARKKRKIVDASDYGDVLPIGWKLVLLLRRREERASLICSRYISPSGQHFVSCKEVSSYLCSFLGPQDATQPYSGYDDGTIPLKFEMISRNTAERFLKDDSSKEGHACCFQSPIPSAAPAEIQADKITFCHENSVKSNLQTAERFLKDGSSKEGYACCFQSPIPSAAPAEIQADKFTYCHENAMKPNPQTAERFLKDGSSKEGHACCFQSPTPYVAPAGIQADKITDCHENFVKPNQQTAERFLKDDSSKEGHACCFQSPFPSAASAEIQAEKITYFHENSMKPHQKNDLWAHPLSSRDGTVKTGSTDASFSESKMTKDRVDTASTCEVHPAPPALQPPLDLNIDSATKSDSKVDGKLDSRSLESKLNTGTVAESCTNEHGHTDESKLNIDGHCVFDDSCAKGSEAMDIDGVELNLFLGNDDSRCVKVDRICNEHQAFKSNSDAPSVAEIQNHVLGVSDSLGEKPKPVMASGSGLQNQHGNEEMICSSEHVEEKDTKLDDRDDFRNNEQIPKKCSVAKTEPRFGFVDHLKWGLTCGIDEEVFVGNSDSNTASNCNFDMQKPDVLFKSRNNTTTTASFDSAAVLNEDAATSVEHTINSESNTCVPSCNEQSFVFEDDGNEVSTCNIFLHQQDKVSENSLFNSFSSIENHAHNVPAGASEQPKLFENNKPGSGLVFDFGSNYTRHEAGDSLDQDSISTVEKPDNANMCWNSQLTNVFSNKQMGQSNAGLKNSYGVPSHILPNAEQMFGDKNNMSGVHCSGLAESGQERDFESSLLSLSSCNSLTGGVEKRFDTGALWDGQKLSKMYHPQNAQPVVGVGSGYFQTELWKTVEASAPQISVTATCPPVQQPSGYFPTFGIVSNSNKDENELFGGKEKFGGLGGVRSGAAEPMEFDFLRGETADSFHGVRMGTGFEGGVWGGGEAPSGQRHLCMWCRNELCGGVCPACKLKF